MPRVVDIGGDDALVTRHTLTIGYDAQAFALWSSLTPTEVNHIVRRVMSL